MRYGKIYATVEILRQCWWERQQLRELFSKYQANEELQENIAPQLTQDTLLTIILFKSSNTSAYENKEMRFATQRHKRMVDICVKM